MRLTDLTRLRSRRDGRNGQEATSGGHDRARVKHALKPRVVVDGELLSQLQRRPLARVLRVWLAAVQNLDQGKYLPLPAWDCSIRGHYDGGCARHFMSAVAGIALRLEGGDLAPPQSPWGCRVPTAPEVRRGPFSPIYAGGWRSQSFSVLD